MNMNVLRNTAVAAGCVLGVSSSAGEDAPLHSEKVAAYYCSPTDGILDRAIVQDGAGTEVDYMAAAINEVGEDGHPELFAKVIREHDAQYDKEFILKNIPEVSEPFYMRFGVCQFAGVELIAPQEYAEVNGTFTRNGEVTQLLMTDGNHSSVIPMQIEVDGQEIVAVVSRMLDTESGEWSPVSIEELNLFDDNHDYATR